MANAFGLTKEDEIEIRDLAFRVAELLDRMYAISPVATQDYLNTMVKEQPRKETDGQI